MTFKEAIGDSTSLAIMVDPGKQDPEMFRGLIPEDAQVHDGYWYWETSPDDPYPEKIWNWIQEHSEWIWAWEAQITPDDEGWGKEWVFQKYFEEEYYSPYFRRTAKNQDRCITVALFTI